jgi:hypothetical protein
VEILESDQVYGMWQASKSVSGTVHRVPPPTLVRHAIGDGSNDPDTDTDDTLSTVRDLFGRCALATTTKTRELWEVWEGYPEGQTLPWAYPSDQWWCGPPEWNQGDSIREPLWKVRAAAYEGITRTPGVLNVSFTNYADMMWYGNNDVLGFSDDGVHPNADGSEVMVEEEFELSLVPALARLWW